MRVQYSNRVRELKTCGIVVYRPGERTEMTAHELADQYRAKCPKAIDTLEECIEEALTFLAFPKLDA